MKKKLWYSSGLVEGQYILAYIVLKKISWRDKMLSKYRHIGRKFTLIHSQNLKKKQKNETNMLQALNLQRHTLISD